MSVKHHRIGPSVVDEVNAIRRQEIDGGRRGSPCEIPAAALVAVDAFDMVVFIRRIFFFFLIVNVIPFTAAGFFLSIFRSQTIESLCVFPVDVEQILAVF